MTNGRRAFRKVDRSLDLRDRAGSPDRAGREKRERLKKANSRGLDIARLRIMRGGNVEEHGEMRPPGVPNKRVE